MTEQDSRTAVYQRNIKRLSERLAAKKDEDVRVRVHRHNLETLGRRLVELEGTVAKLRRALDSAKASAARQAAAVQPARPDGKPEGRRRAAVICGDLSGAAGQRVGDLYDLLSREWQPDILGLVWGGPERTLHPALTAKHRRIRSLPCTDDSAFHTAALGLALSDRYDLVVVCDTDMPGLLVGAMLQVASACPMVADIDSIGAPADGGSDRYATDYSDAEIADALLSPRGIRAARLCRSLLAEVPARTVATRELGARFGGFVVHYAPDRETYDPTRHGRGEARRAMGIARDDFAIIFTGPTGPDDGLDTIAEVLDGLPDKRFVLHVVSESGDPEVGDRLQRFDQARIVLHPPTSVEERPKHLAAADAVVLLNPPSAALRMLPEAAAFGVPILTHSQGRLGEAIDLGLAAATHPDSLADQLGVLLALSGTDRAVKQRRRVRTLFLSEVGHAIAGSRLNLAIDTARSLPVPPAALDRVLRLAMRTYETFPEPAAPDDMPDVIMFWKQNDSGLYGRRADMLMKYLLSSGRIGRVLQFDAPMSADQLSKIARRASVEENRHDRMVLENVLADQFRGRDRPRHLFRTFLWDKSLQNRRLLPMAASEEEFPAFVAGEMARAGINPANAIAWVCPVVPAFPAVADAIAFRGIVGDLIDDQRTFELKPDRQADIRRSYDATVPRLDLALTNCAPMRQAFASLHPAIQLVPNGAELPDPENLAPHPDMNAYPRPVVGYVGHLQDRIDWTLLVEVARLRPDYSFVLVGPGMRTDQRELIRSAANIHVHGPVPYGDVPSVIQAFDIAIVPHETSLQTERMNPLKVYNYVAGGRPIVSTPVANIDPDIAPYVRFAETAETFAEQIDTALDAGPEPCSSLHGDISWESRVLSVLGLLEEARLLSPARGTRPGHVPAAVQAAAT